MFNKRPEHVCTREFTVRGNSLNNTTVLYSISVSTCADKHKECLNLKSCTQYSFGLVPRYGFHNHSAPIGWIKCSVNQRHVPWKYDFGIFNQNHIRVGNSAVDFVRIWFPPERKTFFAISQLLTTPETWRFYRLFILIFHRHNLIFETANQMLRSSVKCIQNISAQSPRSL